MRDEAEYFSNQSNSAKTTRVEVASNTEIAIGQVRLDTNSFYMKCSYTETLFN